MEIFLVSVWYPWDRWPPCGRSSDMIRSCGWSTAVYAWKGKETKGNDRTGQVRTGQDPTKRDMVQQLRPRQSRDSS